MLQTTVFLIRHYLLADKDAFYVFILLEVDNFQRISRLVVRVDLFHFIISASVTLKSICCMPQSFTLSQQKQEIRVITMLSIQK